MEVYDINDCEVEDTIRNMLVMPIVSETSDVVRARVSEGIRFGVSMTVRGGVSGKILDSLEELSVMMSPFFTRRPI